MGFDKFTDDDIDKAKGRFPTSSSTQQQQRQQQGASAEYQKLLIGYGDDDEVECGHTEYRNRCYVIANGEWFQHYMNDPAFHYCEHEQRYCDASNVAFPAVGLILLIVIFIVIFATPSFGR